MYLRTQRDSIEMLVMLGMDAQIYEWTINCIILLLLENPTNNNGNIVT